MEYFELDTELTDLNFSGANGDGNSESSESTYVKPKWQQTFDNLTKGVQTATGYGANKHGIGLKEKDIAPKGKRVTKFGVDPLVFIAISLGLVIASGVAIVVISKK